MPPILTFAQLEEGVATSIAAADEWKAKGDVGWEMNCVRSALDDLLAIAVEYRDSAESGIAYMRDRQTEDLLARYEELNAKLLSSFREGTRVGAVDNDVTVTHMWWLLGQHARGDAQLAIASDAEIAKFWPHTRFWTEYNRALSGLVSRQAYIPQALKLKGYEKCWAPYLDLVAALTAGRDPAPELAACTASFARRNLDKRLVDWKRHDGDGRVPVRWDFRAPSILGRWRAGAVG